MAWFSIESIMKNFGFHDVHSFKDFVAFVLLCAPEQFPVRDYLAPDEQWTLDRAFEGLRYGLTLTAQQKGELPVLAICRAMAEESYTHYREGRKREGFFKLQEMEKLLNKLPSQ
jgi:hypothetical protein